MRGGLLMACTLTLGVAFAAYADSEDQHEIEAAAAAAVRFLEMLEPAQARVAVLPPDSPRIANWSNLPARITRFERNGVRAGDLRDTQRAALFDFLSAALSREGADLVQGGDRGGGHPVRHPAGVVIRVVSRQLLAGIVRRTVGCRRLPLAVRRPPPGESTWR